jgi:hypothetical protein
MIPTNALTGPVPFKIKLADGTIETVAVRELDVLDLYEFIEFAASKRTPDLVALVIQKPREFLRQIDRATYLKIAAKCIELNFDAASQLTEDPFAATKLIPLLLEMRSAGKSAAAAGQTTKPSLPEPALAEKSA